MSVRSVLWVLGDRHRLWHLCVGVTREARQDHLTIIAAGVAFYTFLAVLPALAALVFTYGLFFDAGDVADHVALLSKLAPADVRDLLTRELVRLATTDSSALGLGAVGSGLVAVWSATKGARALIQGINIVENEPDGHGMLALYGLSIVFTLVGLIVVSLTLAAIVTLPTVASWLPPAVAGTFTWTRRLIMPVVVVASIAAIYRFGSCGPSRSWLSAGTWIAAVLWLFCSWLFHRWVEDVATLSASFGSVSTVVAFMLWLYVSSLVILLGAELDVVLERMGRDARCGRSDPAHVAP